MIDITGIIGMGFFNQDPNSNGIFIFKDGSIAFGYKLPGFTYYTMTEAEMIYIYQKLRNILNQLEYFYQGEGGIYQFISERNYSFEEEKKIIERNNYIINDKTYTNKKNLEDKSHVPPRFLSDVIKFNNQLFFDIMEENDLHKFNNYIFVKYKINFNKIKGLNVFEAIKNIFLSLRNDREIIDLNNTIENIISTHNSRFMELDAKPLTLLEMINVCRKFLGFSELKNLSSTKNEDAYLKYLFPGKIAYENDYIKTEEKVYIEDKNKLALDEKEREIIETVNQIKEKDLFLINSQDIKKRDLENDLYFVLTEILGFDLETVKNTPLIQQYTLMKENINKVLEKLEDYMFDKIFKYFTRTHFKVYKFEQSERYKHIINNETYIKIFSVNEIPEMLKIGWGERFHDMPGDYSIVINFKKVNKDEAQIKMRRQVVIERIKISMPIMKWFMPIEVIEGKIATLQQLSMQLEEAEFSRVDTSIYVVLRNNNPYDSREKEVFGFYENVTGMKWMKEKDAPDYHILKCAYPTAITAGSMILSKRSFLINTTNVAQLAPFIKDEEGAKTYLLPMISQRGLIGIDLNQAPAGHFSIQGATGGGKSVIANKIALNYKAYADTVIVTEKGDSFARPALFFGGKVYKPDLSGKIKINPFVMPREAFDENIENYEEIRTQSYIQMKAAMAQMCDNYNKDIQQLYFKILKKAFEESNGKLNRTYVKNFAVTPTKLLGIMRVDQEFKNLTSELKAFEQFTRKGPYGKIFDGNEGLDLNYPYIQIDYSGIAESDMKDFIFKSLLQNIFFEMSKSQNKSFLNINDEFWDVISSSSAVNDSNIAGTSMEQVAAFFRVARKLGGKIGVVSQSITDVANSPLKSAIINNIYHTFFTQTNPADMGPIQELFQLEKEHLDIISNLTMVKGQYSEYFVALAPYGEKLPGRTITRHLRTKFRYYPTMFEYALFTTHPKERLIFEYLYELMGITDKRELETKHVMKAVLFFMMFFPKGIELNHSFQEKLIMNKNDYISAFNDYIQSESGEKAKNILSKLTWNWYFNYIGFYKK